MDERKLGFKEIAVVVCLAILLVAACWFRVYTFSYTGGIISQKTNTQESTQNDNSYMK